MQPHIEEEFKTIDLGNIRKIASKRGEKPKGFLAWFLRRLTIILFFGKDKKDPNRFLTLALGIVAELAEDALERIDKQKKRKKINL
jgi:hypothetical protein